jgi:hypothetical protein
MSIRMPTISSFYGILIRMFFDDHAPPHFHARYGEFEATIDLDSLEIRSRLAALPGECVAVSVYVLGHR